MFGIGAIKEPIVTHIPWACSENCARTKAYQRCALLEALQCQTQWPQSFDNVAEAGMLVVILAVVHGGKLDGRTERLYRTLQ
jgi:hypothetical protein